MPPIIPVFVKVDAAFAADAIEQASARLRAGAWVDGLREYVADPRRLPLVAAAFLLGGYAGEHALAPAMRWLGDDPPDDAFTVPVRLKRSHVRPGFVVDPSLPLGEDALAVFRDADYAAAAMRAMLRAAEREHGALNAEDRASVYERAGERDHFRAVAGEALWSAASSYATLGAAVERLERVTRPGTGVERRSRPNQRRVEQLLLESRVPAESARLSPAGEAPEEPSKLAGTLSEAGKACSSIAAALQRWSTQ
jgi:hypothetical protein